MAATEWSAEVNEAATLDFTRLINRLASQLLEHSSTFEAFVAEMPGVRPDEALAALRAIGSADAERLIADAAIDHAGAIIDQCALLPLPHPLDSEFRFDAPTAAHMASTLVESTRDGDEILLIGVPSVAIEIASMDVDRRIRFLGPDDCVSAAVRRAFDSERLLVDQGVGRSAAAALLDPPWYVEPMAELVRVCAAGCRVGAAVTLVLPPIGTRPEISLDRSEILDVASEAGLVRTGVDCTVSYRTPLFELAAMERQGIARLRSWRSGEAIGFVANGSTKQVRWAAPRPTELSVTGIRLRLVPGGGAGGEKLTPVDRHEVFASVSARAPGRTLATLWTTTNRAFTVDPSFAHAALQAIARKPEVLHSGFYLPENDLSRNPGVATHDRLIHQLVELVGREVHDARRLVGDGAWLKTELEWRS